MRATCCGAIFLCISIFVAGFGLHQVGATTPTLAQQIDNVTNAVNWDSSDPDIVHFGIVFRKASFSHYDAAIRSQGDAGNWMKVIETKRMAEIDGYNSPTIESYLKEALANQTMLGYLPRTYLSSYLVYHRFMLHGYKYAEQLAYETARWNKTSAYDEFSGLYAKNGGPFLWGNPVSGACWGSGRYYDEGAETLDAFMKFAELGIVGADAKANEVWEYINSHNWNPQGQYYPYIGVSGQVECEVAFHTIIGELYALNNRTLPYMERCIADIDYKLLHDGWNSPLWSNYVIRHAEGNQQLRLENTLNAFQVMHTYCGHPNFTDSMKAEFIELLTGSPKAWEGFMQSSLYDGSSRHFRWSSTTNVYDDEATSVGAMLLFLQGIVPSTGSLAIPLNDEYYEDYSRSYPVSQFSFDFSNRIIKIPVVAGELKFQFGLTSTACIFPEDGIYEVCFDKDWSNVATVRRVGNLDAKFHYLAGSAGPPTAMHDLAVIGGITFKTVVTEGEIVRMNVTVANLGDYTETFNVTAYVNTTVIGFHTVTDLAPRNETLTSFSWNTSGFAHAYLLGVYVTQTEGLPRVCECGMKVSCVGDIDGDYITVAKDFVMLRKAMYSAPFDAKWNPNADMNDDGIIGIEDYQIVKRHIPSQLL